MARTQHQVIGSKTEALDRHRKQRQVIAIGLAGEGQRLNEARVDAVAFDSGRHAPLDVQQGIEVRLGKHLTKGFETAFPATHAGQPIMDNGDFH